MRGINKYLAGAVLSASLLFSNAAQAMQISQFDKMTDAQAGDCTVFLIESAANILAAQGDTAGAAKVRDVFESHPGQPEKPALHQFFKNVNAARKINQDNASNPNFKPLVVEQALALTLKENGIIVSVGKLLLASQNYNPSAPFVGAAPARQHRHR